MEDLQFFQHKKFLKHITGIIDSKFLTTENDKVVRVLEIGCGPGDFATLLKNHYKEKIDLTGIDPSEKDIKEAKTKSNEISFYQNGIVDWHSEHQDVSKFDLVIFTKSLHHCDDLEKSIRAAYDLVSNHGLLFADEMNLQNMDTATVYWFLERLDLLKVSGHLNPQANEGNHHHHHQHEHHHHRQEHQHNHEHGDDYSHYHGRKQDTFFTKVLDETVDPIKRFEEIKNHPHIHQPETLLATFHTLFGVDRVIVSENVPFLYYMLIPFGLEKSELGKSILSQFLIQEERAIANGIIQGVGFNITLEKKT